MRLVYRNYTYVVFGLGIDVLIVLVAVLDDVIVAAAVLAFGVRWAMIRVVLDRAFPALVSVRCVDGREIPMSATSASGTMTPSERVHDTWLPALVERLNRSVPR